MQISSFEEAEQVQRRKGGAFLRHRKSGNFILALESGRHTDPATGNSYRTFAIWKPEAPHANYIHDDELNEKYKAVAPERACAWWTQKHATIPPIETIETHIIGGAIIPLWQRLKTSEQACLRVVRVTTEEGQRIVGIQIPPGSVGPVLRSLGLTRDLREPEEIFYAVLNEGEEMTLASNLKLRRGSIHSAAAIELCGADPYKFGQLRQLGLVNEQINWKQRFFIPRDETIGVATLSSLLAQYPVVASTEAEPMQAVVEASNDAPVCKMIDLNEWIIDTSTKTTVDEIDSVNEDQQAADREFITTERTLSVTNVEAPVEENQQHAPLPCFGPTPIATQLAFSFT